jgi:cell division protein FtsB
LSRLPGTKFQTETKQAPHTLKYTVTMQHKKLLQERKIIQLAGLLAVVAILLWVVFSPTSGLVRFFQANEEQEHVRTANQNLQQENTMLQQEVNRLENDPATIEEVARKKFGFLKENEILYDFSKKK